MAVVFSTLLSSAGPALALMIIPGDVSAFTAASARIVRARCLEAIPGLVDVAGARLPATTYRFKVVDRLKGADARKLEFRQLGTANGGARDLGRMAGLPVYNPGMEYLLFLLPESAAGLTSPAGAGQGAYEVAGDVVTPLVAVPRLTTSATQRTRAGVQDAEPTSLSYLELRSQIVALLSARSAKPK